MLFILQPPLHPLQKVSLLSSSPSRYFKEAKEKKIKYHI